MWMGFIFCFADSRRSGWKCALLHSTWWNPTGPHQWPANLHTYPCVCTHPPPVEDTSSPSNVHNSASCFSGPHSFVPHCPSPSFCTPSLSPLPVLVSSHPQVNNPLKSLPFLLFKKKKIQWRQIKQCVQHQNEEVLIFANLYYYLFCPYHPQPITFLSSSPEAGKHWIRHVSFKSMVSYFYYIHVNNIWYGVVCFWTNRRKCFPTICVIYYWYVWTCFYYSNALWYLFLLMRSLLLV